MFKFIFSIFMAILMIAPGVAYADAVKQTKGKFEDKFRQLGVDLPTPNVYRNAAGAPGPDYWQQRADYQIEAILDEEKKRLEGRETITYRNNSPDRLRYLWVSLDQNRFKNSSLARRSETARSSGTRRTAIGTGDSVSFGAMARHYALTDREHGFEIEAVTDKSGNALPFTIVDTMMRIDLPQPLGSGKRFTFNIEWEFNIIDEAIIGGRGGFEHFPKNDTYLFFLAQWFPRMAAYSDYRGWHNDQFLGRGEFTLEFGNYDVKLTVPADHILSSSGELQNPGEVLTSLQRARLDRAREAENPVFIVTPEEALANEEEGSAETKTWHFKAENVRDFAWASSRKFIWDAMGHKQIGSDQPLVMAMSFYPNEAEPIWSKYSTHAVVHTMEVYSRFSFPYPYPTAQSVNTWERGGMEYPMITFNGYRASEDEKSGEVTYSRRIKYGLIGVIIHEIGHIYYPMIVNSDERQWAWMDEGLNTFLEYVAELEWEENFPAWRTKHNNIMDYIGTYMQSENQVPIMTQSDSILQYGPNAYSKPTAALTLLRETVMGRELFDFAFREFSQRWKFKRPTPADFFRSLEDASAVDLDWFWRGWFYSTDHVDIAISSVRAYEISSLNPEFEKPLQRKEEAARNPETLGQIRNREEGIEPRLQRFETLHDFYNDHDRFSVTNKDRNAYQAKLKSMKEWERRTLDRASNSNELVYFIDFVNIGGLVSPLPLTIYYEDDSVEEMMIPAQIWRRNARKVTKLLISAKPIRYIELDKKHELPDVDRSNNIFPPPIQASRIELYKSKSTDVNLMLNMLEKLKKEDASSSKKESSDAVEDTKITEKDMEHRDGAKKDDKKKVNSKDRQSSSQL